MISIKTCTCDNCFKGNIRWVRFNLSTMIYDEKQEKLKNALSTVPIPWFTAKEHKKNTKKKVTIM